ncbi:hypothetical protein JCM18750_37790 [Halostagnicola bangensis]
MLNLPGKFFVIHSLWMCGHKIDWRDGTDTSEFDTQSLYSNAIRSQVSHEDT